MITVCYLLENSATSAIALKQIEDSIPCFTSVDFFDEYTVEVTISCRAEDVTFVHKVLAPYV